MCLLQTQNSNIPRNQHNQSINLFIHQPIIHPSIIRWMNFLRWLSARTLPTHNYDFRKYSRLSCSIGSRILGKVYWTYILFTNKFIYPSTHSPIHSPTPSSIHLFSHQPMHQSIHPSIHSITSNHPFHATIISSVRRSINLTCKPLVKIKTYHYLVDRNQYFSIFLVPF